jgi:hypothetical protein
LTVQSVQGQLDKRDAYVEHEQNKCNRQDEREDLAYGFTI